MNIKRILASTEDGTNNRYWKDGMIAKLQSFLTNYEFEVFDKISAYAEYVNLDRQKILGQIEKIKDDSVKLSKLIVEAKEKK